MENYAQINEFLNSSSFFYTIAIGMNSTYLYVSPNYDRNFGQGKGTLKGQHFSVTLHPEDIRVCETAGPECFKNPGKLFPARLRKHDGRGGFVITQWEMQAMFDAAGEPKGIFCIGYNITEFVHTQEELGQAKDRLDEIGFIQSHGVRRPLANIMGVAKLIAQAEDPGEYPPLIKMLDQSAEELDTIIRSISGDQL